MKTQKQLAQERLDNLYREVRHLKLLRDYGIEFPTSPLITHSAFPTKHSINKEIVLTKQILKRELPILKKTINHQHKRKKPVKL